MAVVGELACGSGAVLAARDEGATAPAVSLPVCGDLADVEHSSDLARTLGGFDPDGPAVQVVIGPRDTLE